MKLLLSGVEHEFMGEPTPKLLHGIYIETTHPTSAKELYRGELEHLYKANGWCLAGMIVTRQHLQPQEVVAHLKEPEIVAIGLGHSALLGPIEHHIMSEYSGMYGVSLWVPAISNQAVTSSESTLH